MRRCTRKFSRGLSDDFDSVFGKRFARAYEQAMQELAPRPKERNGTTGHDGGCRHHRARGCVPGGLRRWLMLACLLSPPPPARRAAARSLPLASGSADQKRRSDPACATPVAVHLYQLAATQKFANADVFALVDHEQATLGADISAPNNSCIKPAETAGDQAGPENAARRRSASSVLFHDIDHAQWRASAPVAASGATQARAGRGKAFRVAQAGRIH